MLHATQVYAHVVKCCSCRQAKHADGKFCLGKDAEGNFQPAIYMY